MITVSGLHVFFGAENYITTIPDVVATKLGRVYAPDIVYVYRGGSLYELDSAVEGGYKSLLSGYIPAITRPSTGFVVATNVTEGVVFYTRSSVSGLLTRSTDVLSGYSASDLVSDNGIPIGWYDIPVLVGNFFTAHDQVSRDDGFPPFTPFTKSDTGLPNLSILDLEVAN